MEADEARERVARAIARAEESQRQHVPVRRAHMAWLIEWGTHSTGSRALARFALW